MASIQFISLTLYNGFRKYIPKSKIEQYDEFLNIQKHTSKRTIKFFNVFVNEKRWIKKPKDELDILLFNYFFVEVPTLGLKSTPLFRRYLHGNTKPPISIRKLKCRT